MATETAKSETKIAKASRSVGWAFILNEITRELVSARWNPKERLGK